MSSLMLYLFFGGTMCVPCASAASGINRSDSARADAEARATLFPIFLILIPSARAGITVGAGLCPLPPSPPQVRLEQRGGGPRTRPSAPEFTTSVAFDCKQL